MVCSGVSACFVNQFSYKIMYKTLDRQFQGFECHLIPQTITTGEVQFLPLPWVLGRARARFPNSGKKSSLTTISHPESSGVLASGWSPGETLGNSKKLTFLIGCLVTAYIVLFELKYPSQHFALIRAFLHSLTFPSISKLQYFHTVCVGPCVNVLYSSD